MDILTDRRFIASGANYPLARINGVRVISRRAYVPLQTLRLLAVLAAIIALLLATELTGTDLPAVERVIAALGAILLLGFAVTVPQVVPTHAIRLVLDTGPVTAMRSSDVRHLRNFSRMIREATEVARNGKH